MKNATREGYQTILKALQEYAHTIQESEKILLNAANVCCEAMGNDKYSTESRIQLEECLESMHKVLPAIEELFDNVYKEYNIAFNEI